MQKLRDMKPEWENLKASSAVLHSENNRLKNELDVSIESNRKLVEDVKLLRSEKDEVTLSCLSIRNVTKYILQVT